MAFIRGFHSVIDKSFVSCFSPQELQHLISGDQTELDVDDLRLVCEWESFSWAIQAG